MSKQELAEKIAKEVFNYDGPVTFLGYGTKGNAFIVDNGKKILKITSDQDEALRAEKLRGKWSRNLMGYYDIRKVSGSKVPGGKVYALLMDKLPKVLTDKDDPQMELALSIYFVYLDNFDIDQYANKMPGHEIKDNRYLKKAIRRWIESGFELNQTDKDLLSIGTQKNIQNFVARASNNSIKLLQENVNLATTMWYDIIMIKRQMKKFGVESNDLTQGNLGFNEMGRLVFFDLGYPSGHFNYNKKLRNLVSGRKKDLVYEMRYLKTFENFINEGLIKSHSPQKVEDYIKNLGFKDDEFRVRDGKLVLDLKTKYREVYSKLIKTLENVYGWVLTGYQEDFYEPIESETTYLLKDIESNLLEMEKEGFDPDSYVALLYFEPKFYKEIPASELPDVAYHVTDYKYIDKIMKKGLVPKHKDKLTKHPDRVYLFIDKKNIQGLIDNINFGVEVEKPFLLEVDISEYKKNNKFYIDPNLDDGGVYVTNTISPNLITPKHRLD